MSQAKRRRCVVIWVDRVIAGLTMYPDIDDARAVAERLAEEPG